MNTEKYLVKEKKKLNLYEVPTTYKGKLEKEEVKDVLIPANIEKMRKYHEKLYAENNQSLLIVLQAMDAAGKDSLIKNIMTGVNPQGTKVVSFKKPSENDLDHDYLWRVEKELPPRGEIGIFNRSHYEDVLVSRVHNLVLNQPFPKNLVTKDIWEKRFEEINNFEEHRDDLEIVVEFGDDIFEETLSTKLPIEEGKSIKNIEIDQLNMVKLWDIENPKLYEIKVKLLKGSEVIDEYKDTFGFREAEFRQDGFYLNGRRVKLVGLNRHQAYPYVGYAMPQRVQEKDAEILKYELGLNIVRTSHYPQSIHFLRKCDEIGLLVFEEIPGWQHIGDEAWQAESIKNVKEMIKRDYNRPSIVLWGVRINESQDSHEFYVKTNAMAKSLDPIRQTGGVRYLENSDFLEDVYTMNDFIHSGGEKVLRTQGEVTGQADKVPYLVTEYNGHMYPTKSFDQECKKVEHAYRHLRVINESFGLDEISGAIGWCAFDYNTHSSFGSGDKICYHGVSDMFRNPKYAAYSYASQKKVEDGVVLEPITLGAKGERDGGAILPFTVLTNCDYIKIFKDGIYIDTYYPNKEKFPNLPHPPIEVSHILSMDSEIPLTEEAKKEIKDFVLNKLKDSNLTNLAEEDFKYIEEFSERVNIPVFKIMSLVYKLAGGWGDKENSLIIKGFIDNKEVASKEIGELRSMNKLEVTPDDLELSLDKTSYDKG